MSAKRRQETIARFSVPIKEDAAPAPATIPTQSNGRTTRQRKRTNNVIPDDDILVPDDDGDADFVADGDDDDDDFIVDDEPKKQTKATSKAKGKRRESPKTAFDDLMSASFDGPNPKIMLISLKAGALGLNLTVANNVYL